MDNMDNVITHDNATSKVVALTLLGEKRFTITVLLKLRFVLETANNYQRGSLGQT